MKKKFLPLVVLSLMSLSLSAFWWDKPAEKRESSQVKAESKTQAFEPAVKPKESLKKKLAADSNEQPKVPETVGATQTKKIEPVGLPPAAAMRLSKPAAAPAKLTPAPVQTKVDIQKIIQLNKNRQAELKTQLAGLNKSMVQAKTYNKILTNMYPSGVGKAIADRAVGQEKIQVLHNEAKILSPKPPVPVAALEQAKAATKAVESSRLPIGKYAPKKQETSSR